MAFAATSAAAVVLPGAHTSASRPRPITRTAAAAPNAAALSGLRTAAPSFMRPTQQLLSAGIARGGSGAGSRGVATMGLFGLGLPELVVIGGVAAVLFGPSKLPELGKSLGKTVKSFQAAATEFSEELKEGKAADEAKEAAAGAAALKDIVDTAVGAGSFGTLAAALGAAGLVDTLKSPGPFTVFAPTDAAFAKLPAGTVEDLLKPENKAKLASILTYHVVAGKVMAKDVVTLKEATTVNGAKVTIDCSAGVKVDGATVVTTDIECSNGVIHIIDSVMIPK